MPKYGFSLTRILPYKAWIVDFVLIRDNTGQRKLVFQYILRKGWYTYDVHENCPIFKTPYPPCPSTSKILSPPWLWTSNFKRTPRSLQIITNKLIENTIQWWLLYVIRFFPSFRLAFVFSINSLILPGFSLASFHLHSFFCKNH